MKAILITTLTAVLGASAMSARAAEPAAGSWDVQSGPAYIDFHENIALSVSGAPVPGAGGKAQDNTTLAAEVTHHVTPSWSAAVTVGFPPRYNITGTGTAEALGSLGAVRHAPIALIGKYQFNTESAWHPYLGAGGVY